MRRRVVSGRPQPLICGRSRENVSKSDPIKKVTLKNGKTRYRFVIDVGRKADGRRDQRTYTYNTLKEAREQRAKIIAESAKGTFVADSAKTVAEHLPEWLAGRRKLQESTRTNYANSLKPVIERLGHIPLQKLTKTQVDDLVTWMLESGRRVGKKGRPLAPATVTLTLGRLAQALDDAVKQGILVRNVARLVDSPGTAPQKEMSTWTAEQAAAFLAYVAEDRLFAAWCLSLYGLRRGEVLGLRWCDIDLEAKTLTVCVTRIIVKDQVVHSTPKSARSKRTLPLDDTLVAALRRLKSRRAQERLKAGRDYRSSCQTCNESHVFVDEVGEEVDPESYSDRFEVLVRRAGLPLIRLHDTRHTCGTLMHLRNVPAAVISAWLGHANVAFTMKTYVHSQDEALKAAGGTLGAVYGTTEKETAADDTEQDNVTREPDVRKCEKNGPENESAA
ncbi:site-specific integrase [Micromonospora andamanensis]|uniref:site-specific integrase n=1 Tax=Micromonospora andamanensis TaxID=1287068 RepID=UPI00367132A7